MNEGAILEIESINIFFDNNDIAYYL